MLNLNLIMKKQSDKPTEIIRKSKGYSTKQLVCLKNITIIKDKNMEDPVLDDSTVLILKFLSLVVISCSCNSLSLFFGSKCRHT